VQLTHSFRVPVPVEEAWVVLRDIERIAPCMPGATIDAVDGDHFTGGVKVKVGPITVTYRGEADFVNVDEEHHRAAIEAKGKETRGTGTARATVHAELRQVGSETEVTLVTDLNVTGKPAQFGRGVMADVGGKLIDQFATCLSSELASPSPSPTVAAAASTPSSAVGADPAAEVGVGGGTGPAPAVPSLGPEGTVGVDDTVRTGPAGTPSSTSQPRAPRPSDDAIDLLGVAGSPLLQRLAPLAAAVAAVLLLLSLLRRRRRRRAVAVATAARLIPYGVPTVAVVTLQPVEDEDA
jgi:carbon monoxide dehydrogenase subunit G